MTTEKILAYSGAAVLVLLALVFLMRSRRGREVLFDLCVKVLTAIAVSIEEHAIELLDELIERLLRELSVSDPLLAQEIEMRRYDRAVAGNPYPKNLPY